MDFRNLLGTLNQLNESVEVVAEKITKDMSAEEIIKDFQQSDDPKFNGKSQEERKNMALGAYYDMHPEKSNESVEEANESPDERLKALGDLYQNAIDTIKRTENIMNMTPPGPNRDYYETEIGQMEEYAKKIKKDHQALEAGIKGADAIRANSSVGETVVGGNVKPADPNSVYARLMNDINEIQKGAMEGDDMADFIADELGDYLRNGDVPAGSVYEKAISIVMDALHDGADAQAEAAEQAGDFLHSELNKEDFDRDAFRESFMRMVEAKGKKPNDGDLANNAKPYDKVTRADVIAGATGNDEMGGKKKKKKADESVAEGKSKHPKGSKKYKDQMAAKHANMNDDINESFEKFFAGDKLTFEEAVKIVRESGGQQKIDPVDTALWNWAQRVAANKFTESRKAEMFAGLVYERNGGEFQIRDVLSED